MFHRLPSTAVREIDRRLTDPASKAGAFPTCVVCVCRVPVVGVSPDGRSGGGCGSGRLRVRYRRLSASSRGFLTAKRDDEFVCLGSPGDCTDASR